MEGFECRRSRLTAWAIILISMSLLVGNEFAIPPMVELMAGNHAPSFSLQRAQWYIVLRHEDHASGPVLGEQAATEPAVPLVSPAWERHDDHELLLRDQETVRMRVGYRDVPAVVTSCASSCRDGLARTPLLDPDALWRPPPPNLAVALIRTVVLLI